MFLYLHIARQSITVPTWNSKAVDSQKPTPCQEAKLVNYCGKYTLCIDAHRLSSSIYLKSFRLVLAALTDQSPFPGLWQPFQYLSLWRTSKQHPQPMSLKEHTTASRSKVDEFSMLCKWKEKGGQWLLLHSISQLEHYLQLFTILWWRPPRLINYGFRYERLPIVCNCSYRRCQNNPFHRRGFGTWPKNIQCSLHCRFNQFCLMEFKVMWSTKSF